MACLFEADSRVNRYRCRRKPQGGRRQAAAEPFSGRASSFGRSLLRKGRGRGLQVWKAFRAIPCARLDGRATGGPRRHDTLGELRVVVPVTGNVRGTVLLPLTWSITPRSSGRWGNPSPASPYDANREGALYAGRDRSRVVRRQSRARLPLCNPRRASASRTAAERSPS